LRDVLQTQYDGTAQRDTDVLQSILDRLAALEAWAVSSGAPSPPDGAQPTQPHLTLDQVRAINEMLQAGRSAEEIMTVMGRPIPSREEIKRRLLDEIAPPATT